ncbi:ATP synthase F1 subunit delta [Stieleria varia]|uniref:ATP synthase subunit delta n=1 Tax=Stieleria varia TaxID=2528005 RepID=A0A5C6AY32_9BACT|nr:ATP synthase F1 subunit delta [Stieleria varia]TWU04367.1 ATP synthase subunit delta [Stieleria varia]
MIEPDSVKHETVLDTGAEQMGKTYAQALIGAALKAGVADQVVEQLAQVVDGYLGQSPRLAAALASPRIGMDEKVRVIDRLFGGDFHPLLVTFMKVMASRERLGYLAAVRNGAETIYDEMSGRVLATVSTAVPLTDDLRGQITSQLSGTLGKNVRLKEVIDTDLIGGMVIRVGDTVFDNSVANRLEKLEQRTRQGFANALLSRFGELVGDS